MIDLSTWNLTLPVGVPAVTIETPQLAGGYQDHYFQAKNGAIFFWAPVNGSTTRHSEYPRSELRESQTDGDPYNWKYPEAEHVLDATLQVTQMPSSGDISLGQVHSAKGSRPPLMLRFQYDASSGLGDLMVAFREKPSHEDSDWVVLLADVRLNQSFSYRITLSPSGDLMVQARAPDGSLRKWQDRLDRAWASYPLYFKAGVYTMDNKGNESEAGAATFSALKVRHRDAP
ncbi:MAG: polysaccharide lyase family 7 protein [Pseudomonadota bacterium]